MDLLLRAFDLICQAAIRLLVRVALAIDRARLRLPKGARAWRGSVRRVWRRWLERVGLREPTPRGWTRRPRPWNRTPDHIEEQVVRLHVATPILGGGQLARLVERVLGVSLTRETVRRIVIRRRELVLKLQDAEKRRRRRISASAPRQIWGLDLTLVWILGFIPAWVLGVVDYHGSRVVALRRLRWPTAVEIARTLDDAIAVEGAPRRLLTDRGPVFMSLDFQLVLAAHGVDHVRTRPAHPWTNGRIERLFRTFKETVFGLVWLVRSTAQLDRFCADFVTFYNRDHPHSSYGGRTPDEVWSGTPPARARGRVTYFDGLLRWYRFG